MAISKEQADAIGEVLIAPAKQEAARVAALREAHRRNIMPLRWRLLAILAGTSVGAFIYSFALAQTHARVVAICMLFSVGIAQLIWSRKVDS